MADQSIPWDVVKECPSCHGRGLAVSADGSIIAKPCAHCGGRGFMVTESSGDPTTECPGCNGAGRVRVGPRRGCYITTAPCDDCNGTGRVHPEEIGEEP